MLQIKVHPEVYNELEQARSWYENQAKGLGPNSWMKLNMPSISFDSFQIHGHLILEELGVSFCIVSLSQSYADMIRIKFRYLLLCIYAENLGILRTEKFKVCAEELAQRGAKSLHVVARS